MKNNIEKYSEKLALGINPKASFIIEELNKNGFVGYIVGGCVRDIIIGRVPNDWDITSSARPSDVMNIFEKTIPTGIEHGTVTVVVDGENFEITTFRIDGEYTNCRKPDNVYYSDDVLDDLSRRDFTVNSMAYNQIDGLIDEYGGIYDIGNKIIRSVGNPDIRFNEDALRILRAVRFSAKLGYNIEDETYLSMLRNSENLKKISMERINNEVEEIIDRDVSKLRILEDINIYEYIFGIKYDYELDFNEFIGIGDVNLKKAIIYKDLSREVLYNSLKRLRYSNKVIDEVLHMHMIINESYDILMDSVDYVNSLYRDNDGSYDKNMTYYKKIINIWIKRLFKLSSRDIVEKTICALNKEKEFFLEKKLNLDVCFDEINDIIETGQCFSISDLKLNGKDIIENKIASGRQIGIILDRLCDYVILHPELNRKEKLIEISKNMLEVEDF